MRQKYLYQQAVTCLYPNLKLSHQIKKIGIFRHFIKRKNDGIAIAVVLIKWDSYFRKKTCVHEIFAPFLRRRRHVKGMGKGVLTAE